MTERESAARRLRGGVWPVLDQASEHARRERIASSIVGLTRKLETRRQRRRRWTLGVAAAALVCAASVMAVMWPIGGGPDGADLASRPSLEVRLLAGQASVHLGSDVVPLAGSVQLSPDAELVTPANASAELRLSSSTEVSVAPSSELEIRRQRPSPEVFEERVRLRAGSVALAVPKLGTRGKVSVETRDALVEVHGTRFSVQVVKEAPGVEFTEVKVREGRVLVRAAGESHMLGAGDSFSTRPAVSPQIVSPPPAPVTEAPAPAGPEKTVSERRGRKLAQRRPATPPSPSELAEQNRLLEAAELAQRSGMSRLAVERLERLITRYPDSELAHNARVERFRVLERSGQHPAAVGAARAYLERHPDGFARDEAERLIGDGP
jgi:ferric-dicitrate binding protein FerR (iron transport regulator)